MAEQKKKRINAPMTDGHIKQVQQSRQELARLIEQHQEHLNKISNAAFLMDDKDAKRLDAVIEVHNIRNSARSIKVYFEMMGMLLENIESDVTLINAKRKLWKEYIAKEIARQEAEKEERKKREKERERKAIERAEKKNTNN